MLVCIPLLHRRQYAHTLHTACICCPGNSLPHAHTLARACLKVPWQGCTRLASLVCIIFFDVTFWLQVWVYGNSFKSCLVAVVVPVKETLMAWAKENGVAGDYETVCANDKAKAYMLGVR